MYTNSPSGSKRCRADADSTIVRVPPLQTGDGDGLRKITFSGDAEAAAQQLLSDPHIGRVRFDGMRIASDDAPSLGRALKGAASLHSVSFERCEMGLYVLTNLLNELSAHPGISSLQVTLDADASREISDALSHLPERYVGLKKLRLVSSTITTVEIGRIVRLLSKRTESGRVLTTLSLTGTPTSSLLGWCGAASRKHPIFVKRLDLRDLSMAPEAEMVSALARVLFGQGFETLGLFTPLSAGALTALELYREENARDVVIARSPDEMPALAEEVSDSHRPLPGRSQEPTARLREARAKSTRKKIVMTEATLRALELQRAAIQLGSDLDGLNQEILLTRYYVATLQQHLGCRPADDLAVTTRPHR